MPAWRGKLTDDQIWKLAAYVRSLSGQPSKDAVSSRADEMSETDPADARAARAERTTSDTARAMKSAPRAAAVAPLLLGALQLPALPEHVRRRRRRRPPVPDPVRDLPGRLRASCTSP